MEGTGVAAFLTMLVIVLGAFFAVDSGAFDKAPSARIFAFPHHDSAGLPAKAGASTGTTAISRESSVSKISSIGKISGAAAPACNVEACARAYRSFRSADCTFQPFDGARRSCTR